MYFLSCLPMPYGYMLLRMNTSNLSKSYPQRDRQLAVIQLTACFFFGGSYWIRTSGPLLKRQRSVYPYYPVRALNKGLTNISIKVLFSPFCALFSLRTYPSTYPFLPWSVIMRSGQRPLPFAGVLVRPNMRFARRRFPFLKFFPGVQALGYFCGSLLPSLNCGAERSARGLKIFLDFFCGQIDLKRNSNHK